MSIVGVAKIAIELTKVVVPIAIDIVNEVRKSQVKRVRAKVLKIVFK